MLAFAFAYMHVWFESESTAFWVARSKFNSYSSITITQMDYYIDDIESWRKRAAYLDLDCFETVHHNHRRGRSLFWCCLAESFWPDLATCSALAACFVYTVIFHVITTENHWLPAGEGSVKVILWPACLSVFVWNLYAKLSCNACKIWNCH